MTTTAKPYPLQRDTFLLPLILLAGMVGLVMAAGMMGYTQELAQARAETGRMLAAVTDLKVRQVSTWLNERRSDADLAMHDEQFTAQTEDWLLRGAPDDAIGHSLKSHIQAKMLANHYRSVMLLDNDLIMRVAVGTTPAITESLRRAARDALQKTTVTFVDDRTDTGNDQSGVFFTLLAPLRVSDADPPRVAGLLAFTIDPNRYLYPLLDWWPTRASSGTSYLMRRNGEQLSYMNGPRDVHSRRPLIPTRLDRLIDAQTAQHQTALVEGLDYRQQPVLADARRIPDTDWLLVTKLDKAEIARSARTPARGIMLLTAAFLTLIGGLGWFWWRRSSNRYRLAELERQVLVQHLDYLSKYANDAILLMDDKGKIIEGNDKALSLYGYTRKELLGLPYIRLRTAEAQADFDKQWQQADLQQGLVFETMHQHKDGSAIPVEVSARLITVDGKRFRQSIVRDISERKKAEDDIIRARDFYVSLLDIFPNPVWRAGVDATCNYFNQAWLDFTGRELEDELGNGWAAGVHTDDLDACMDTYLNAFKDRQPFMMEFRLRYHDGSYHWLADYGQPYFDLHGNFAGYIGSCYDMQQIKTAEERMEFLANHDSLTHLPNRMLLHDRIERALSSARREGRQVAVLFIDLDRFKDINDTLGHTVGDQLLHAFSDRLSHCVRDADTVSRLGGDEFVVVIPELREAADAVPVAQKIIDAMAVDFSIENHNLRVTPSIGISVFPHDGQDAQTLINNADTAMYSVKQSGRNAIQFYSPDLYISAHERLNMKYGLRHALAHGEFELHYQPQIDVQTHSLVGLEALLRWRHPGKGLLLPAQFLPVAETSGLIVSIGRWVLKTACAQCRIWQTAEMAVPVCVNLSPTQFQQWDLLKDISAALHDSGLPAELLCISITESTLKQTDDSAQETLKALHALGVGVTIDDFDAAQAPLEQGRLHTIDTFMLHHKYVRNITHSSEAAALTGSLIDMAHGENLKVIAEGVETQDQLNLLSAQGCDAVQGFYFSEALPAERLDDYLNQRRELGATASRH